MNLPPDVARTLSGYERRIYELERRRLPDRRSLPAWVTADMEITVTGLGGVNTAVAVTFVPYCAYIGKPTFYFGYRGPFTSAHACRISEPSWTLSDGLYTAVTALITFSQVGTTVVNVTFEGEGIVFV